MGKTTEPETYGKALLTRAVARAGSGYALARTTEIQESHISEALKGKRQVPASWVLKLARVAEVDPLQAMEHHDAERAERKKKRQQLSRSVLAGAAAICAIFGTLSGEQARASLVSHAHETAVNCVYIVSRRVRTLVSRLRAWA
jgi:DNA-binding transcriptional regulator YdaS (Cro superfamily)